MQSKRKIKKRTWMLVGLAVVVAAGLMGLSALRNWRDAQMQSFEEQMEATEIVAAFVGDLATSATASGQVAAARDAGLSLGVTGTVGEVWVEVGDAVRAGEPLLALETAGLERAFESARQALAIQEANLAALLERPMPEEVTASRASVVSAQANLEEMLAGPSEDEVTSAEASLRAAQADVSGAWSRYSSLTAEASADEIRAAEIELEMAQRTATAADEQYDSILGIEPDDRLPQDRLDDMRQSAQASAAQANATLLAAQEALEALNVGNPNSIAAAQAGLALAAAQRDAAQAQLDLALAGPTAAQVAAAEASVAQAEANLDRLTRGPSASQVRVSEIQVEQARIGVQRAENDLAKAILVAPFDGTITAVHVSAGEQAGGVLIEMVDAGGLEVVLEVDEVDIGELAIGQPAVITLESWLDEEIEGQVVAIAPQATAGGSAVISYKVYLSLGATDRPVRVGMTANADLVTNRRENVLLVPNEAISPDRARGTFSVNRVERDANGNPITEEVQVTIGLRDSKYTQVTGGLNAGDEVMIGNPPPTPRFGPGGRSGQGGGPGAIRARGLERDVRRRRMGQR